MFSRRLECALKLCVSLTLLARGWLTWRWDSPIRGLVWKEDWWSGILEQQTNLTWIEFAKISDPWITNLLATLGIILMVLAIVPWLPFKATKWRRVRWLLVPATLILVLDSVARWVDMEFDFGMAIEHLLQMLAPIALLIATGQKERKKLWIGLVTVGVALTFVGHGLYAVGFHPVPLSYQTMTMKLLRCEQDFAMVFLQVVGWLDFVAAACLVFRPLRSVGLIYMVGWGLATALARVFSHLSLAGLDPWMAETLVRTSHWLLPLILLGAIWKLDRARSKNFELPSTEMT